MVSLRLAPGASVYVPISRRSRRLSRPKTSTPNVNVLAPPEEVAFFTEKERLLACRVLPIELVQLTMSGVGPALSANWSATAASSALADEEISSPSCSSVAMPQPAMAPRHSNDITRHAARRALPLASILVSSWLIRAMDGAALLRVRRYSTMSAPNARLPSASASTVRARLDPQDLREIRGRALAHPPGHDPRNRHT